MSQLRPISEFQSPGKAPAPPVSTRHQALPFDQLPWEVFESLCLRLVSAMGAPEFCRFYGECGDAQDGIDFFAKLQGSTKYRVYQCKRVKKFTPGEFNEAVKRFLDGGFAATSESLTICASLELKRRKLSDEIEVARKKLAAKGVALEVWDATQLSQTLKGMPDLVEDFFGPAWREAFCGHAPPPWWRKNWWVFAVALVLSVGIAAAWVVSEQRAADPSRWLRFETLSIYKVIPDPATAAGGSREVFMGVVLDVRNESDRRTFGVDDLVYSGGLRFEPVGPGGLISRIEGLGAPARVVGGGALAPHSKATVAIAFPFIHSEISPAPTGGVMPVFIGEWTLIVDGKPVKVDARYKQEGTVLRPQWDTVIDVADLKLKPLLHNSTVPNPWQRPSDLAH